MIYQQLAIVGLIFFIYSISLRQLERAELTGPILFVSTGALLGFLYASPGNSEFSVSNWLPLVELTLAVFLFTDAAKARLAVVKSAMRYPILLLSIALPVTFVAITLCAIGLFPDMGWLGAALLAIILSPTDAALSKAFLDSDRVPAELKESINIESGLNDGLCVPAFLFLFASWQLGQLQGGDFIAGLVLKEIGIALVSATVISLVTIQALRFADKKHYFEADSSPFLFIGLAVAIFCITQLLHGSGFVAVFVAGLLFDRFYQSPKTHQLIEESEHIAEFFALFIWCVFGAFAYVQLAHQHISWQIWLFAVLAASMLRLLPVMLSLKLFSSLPFKHNFTLAWFGPRGLASIVFCMMVMQHSGGLIPQLATLSILCSVFIHGMTTRPIVLSFSRGKDCPISDQY